MVGKVLWNRVCPSVLPLVCKFSRNWFTSFFWNLTWCLGPYIVVCDKSRFFWKNPHWAEMTKNSQKCSKSRALGLFKNFTSLVLSGIGVKRKFLWFINILHSAETTCLGKIWFSSYNQKWLSANEISVFFNCQYFINRLISDFDFWHADRHE